MPTTPSATPPTGPPARRSRSACLAAVVVSAVAGGALAGGVGLATAPAAVAGVLGDRLQPGTALRVGDALRSPSGIFTLVLQSDGNLVEYVGARAVWSSGTPGRGGTYVSLQGDGNLVLHTASGAAVWATYRFSAGPTALQLRDDGGLVTLSAAGVEYWGVHPRGDQLGPGGALRVGQTLFAPTAQYRLTLQGDGNLVLYSVTNVPVWNSRTSGSMAALTMQPDGDLVLRRTDGSTAWHSDTSGRSGASVQVFDDAAVRITTPTGSTTSTVWRTPAVAATLWRNQGLQSGTMISQGTSRLMMQTDGNLVRYSGTTAVWSSKTSSPGAVAAMQRDGNLVVYSAAGVPLWSSRTAGTSATFLRLSGAGIAFLGNATTSPNWIEGPPNWVGLAKCESGGNPRAVNPAGYYGLYQFDLRTWTANGGTGNPIDASPAVQTAVATTLYLARGRQPWPVCGAYL